MKTLTRHPEPVAAPVVEAEPAVAEPVADGPAVAEGTTPETTGRACATCAAPLAAGQDWCLECGTAAPGRLGRRPGWRAVGTTLALTFVLVGSAGAASYAALSSDATRGAAGAPLPDGTPVAQVPPVIAAPPAPVLAPPKVAVPKATPPPATPAVKLPTAPKVSTPPPAAVTVPKVTTSAPAPAEPKPTTDTTATPRGTDTTGTDATPKPVVLTPLTLAAGAASLYDPYKRAITPGDPAAAIDGDAPTAFGLSAPADGKDMQVGVVVDLGTAKRVRGLRLTLTVPGAGVEVYGADGSTLPPTIVDTRWDHPASVADAHQIERIVFPKDGSAYRFVTVWLTQAPAGGPQVGVAELQVLH